MNIRIASLRKLLEKNKTPYCVNYLQRETQRLTITVNTSRKWFKSTLFQKLPPERDSKVDWRKRSLLPTCSTDSMLKRKTNRLDCTHFHKLLHRLHAENQIFTKALELGWYAEVIFVLLKKPLSLMFTANCSWLDEILNKSESRETFDHRCAAWSN